MALQPVGRRVRQLRAGALGGELSALRAALQDRERPLLAAAGVTQADANRDYFAALPAE